MTHASAPTLPSGVQRLVDLAIDAVWRGRRALLAQYGSPEAMRRSNAGAFADLGWALVRVRRLARILRYVFVTLACWIEVTPGARRRTAGASPASGGEAFDAGAGRSTACRRGAGGPAATARFSLGTPMRFRAADHIPAQQPPHLANATRNDVRTLARRIEALTHALLDPLPYVRRMARKLLRRGCFIRRAPKRLPSRRAHLVELADIREHARFELRRLRRDSS